MGAIADVGRAGTRVACLPGFLALSTRQKGRRCAQGCPASKALAPTATFQKPNDNLLDDVNVHLIERAKLLKRRARAAEQRQRRLIDKLKHPQESESKHA